MDGLCLYNMEGLDGWAENYPDLINLRDSISYESALDSFLSMTGMGVFMPGTDPDSIDGYLGHFEELIRKCRNKDDRDRVVGKRMDLYQKYAGLFSPDFSAISGLDSRDLFQGVAKSFYHADYQLITETFPREFDSTFGANRDFERGGALYDDVSYFYSLLYVLLSKKHRAFSVPFAEHKEGESVTDEQSSFLREVTSSNRYDGRFEQYYGSGSKVFQEAVVLNAAMLSFFRMFRTESGDSYPIEVILHQNSGHIEKYVMSLLRLVLGRNDDFSDVLQEDLILSQAKNLAQRYGFYESKDGKVGVDKIADRIRDLRVRIFEHGNIFCGRRPVAGAMSSPGSYLSKVGGERMVLDLGSGPFARFPNLVSRAYPGSHAYGVDVAVHNDCFVNGVDLRKCHFDNEDDFRRLRAEIAGRADFILASNLFHKLKDPASFLRNVIFEMINKSVGGILYLIHPVYSGVSVGDERIYLTGSEHRRAIRDQDNTRYSGSLWSFEKLMDFLLDVLMENIRIQIESLSIGSHSENDTSKRIFLALRVPGNRTGR